MRACSISVAGPRLLRRHGAVHLAGTTIDLLKKVMDVLNKDFHRDRTYSNAYVLNSFLDHTPTPLFGCISLLDCCYLVLLEGSQVCCPHWSCRNYIIGVGNYTVFPGDEDIATIQVCEVMVASSPV